MAGKDPIQALDDLRSPFGNETRSIAIGGWTVRMCGLDRSIARTLEGRWGPFVESGEPGGRERLLTVDLADGGDGTWLERTREPEAYRVEAFIVDGRPVLRSYHFLAGATHPGTWRAVLARSPDEPIGRVIENVLRMVLARCVVERGGVAFHGAGVLRDDGAHLLVGPSGSGKTTAVGLSRSVVALGDDYAIALPSDGGWRTSAVPFDNAEAIEREPPRGWLKLSGVWRLFKSDENRVDTVDGLARDLSILACAAAPWAMPDLSERLMDNVARLGREVRYGHLRFRRSHDFWDRIGPV
jgi:hypothetical protein